MGDLARRVLRHSAVLCVCLVDVSWMLMMSLSNRRWKKAVAICLMFSLVVWWRESGRTVKVGYYSVWRPERDAHYATSTRHFTENPDRNVFMYSAIANFHEPLNGELNVVVTSLESTNSWMECCVLVDNSTVFRMPARSHYFHHKSDIPILNSVVEYFQPELHFARQRVCSVPNVGHVASHVTLASASSSQGCSGDVRHYLPIQQRPAVPGGLAICAKIAHSGGLDPEKVIEWFELQKILGVDKVLMFDLGNPESLNRVLRHYQAEGILELHPYELPGEPKNRTLSELFKRTKQFSHDETLALLDCRQRMAGYTYILSHDVDEFIVPRKNVSLKVFIKEKMEQYQDAAGFYFYAEFFIYNWGASHPERDLMLTRFRRATLPHWECTKYVYLPSRVLATSTHTIHPHSPYSSYKIEADEAVLHHYRNCPDDVWPTCQPETIVDDIMTRYTDLHRRVLRVRTATGTRTQWGHGVKG